MFWVKIRKYSWKWKIIFQILKKNWDYFHNQNFPPSPPSENFSLSVFFHRTNPCLEWALFLPQKLFFSKKCCFPLEIRKIFEFPKKIFLDIFFKNYYFYIWDILINFYFHDDAQKCCFPLEIWKIFEFTKKYFQKYFLKLLFLHLGHSG